MACSIKFVRLDDFIADVDSLDLMANGYSLADNGYLPVSAPDGVSSVHEVITLKLQGTSKDDLAAMTQDIDEKVKQVGWWLNNPGVERYQVWLRVQLDGETYPRQAQILDILPPDKVRVFTPEEVMSDYIGGYSIAIERTPFWEDPYAYPTTTTKTGLSSIGGMTQLSETISGDVPARLLRLSGLPEGGASHSIYFVGWKTNRSGTTPANFVPVWDCKDGANSADTTDTAFTYARSGTAAVCDFSGGATLTDRVTFIMSSITANAADQRGTYQVLLRASMSNNTSIARVRMKYGFGYIGGGPPSIVQLYQPLYRSRVVINGDLYNTGNNAAAFGLFELGAVSIPPARIPSGIDISNFCLNLEAERISGSGSLYFDCLILIPINEGFVKMKIENASLGSPGKISAYQYPDGEIVGNSDTGGQIYAPVQTNPINWGLPANDVAPYVIVASQSGTLISTEMSYVSVKGETLGISYVYSPCWRTLRGNET